MNMASCMLLSITLLLTGCNSHKTGDTNQTHDYWSEDLEVQLHCDMPYQ